MLYRVELLPLHQHLALVHQALVRQVQVRRQQVPVLPRHQVLVALVRQVQHCFKHRK